jgi:hypothetical protein
MFMRYNVYQGDMFDLDGSILKDVYGHAMQGRGSWRKHSPLKQFKSAISSLNHYRGYPDKWEEYCSACVEKEESTKNGCDRHTGKKIIENTGNPVESEVFRAEYRTLDALVIHDVDSAKALDPFQLETMVRYFLQEAVRDGNIKAEFIQVIAMLLCSVSAFLRDDDLKNLEVMDIRPADSFILSNGQLDHIAISVSGKGELNVMTRVVLITWRNRNCDLLDPLNW